jgi:hypothetical protein
MILYFKDEDGNEHAWTELEEGIYEIRKILQGKQLSLTRADDLGQAMILSQFSPYKQKIAEKLSYKMYDPISCKNMPLSVSSIFETIDSVLKTGPSNVKNKAVISELEMY